MQVLFIIAAIVFSSSLSMGQNSEPYFFENDSEGAGWINCGEGPSWHLDSEQFHNGTGSLKSGDLECNGISKVCRDIQGPASIEFWWKSVPIPNSGSQLSFYVDGKRERSWNSDWRREPPIYMSENRSYTVTWVLNKKSCPPGTKGSAWIDDVIIKYDFTKVVPEQYVDPEQVVIPVAESNNITVYVSKSPNPRSFIYGSINEAIEHVVPGGTVIVDRGDYFEQISISNPLTLAGKGKTIIHSDQIAITAKSDNIIIKNISVQGISGNNESRGILVLGDNCSILSNSISNFYEGIVADGCHDVSITDNNVSHISRVGIYLLNTTNPCDLQQNDISYAKHAICLYNAIGAKVDNNSISNSENGISLRASKSRECKANHIGLGNIFSSIEECDISDESDSENKFPPACKGSICRKCE